MVNKHLEKFYQLIGVLLLMTVLGTMSFSSDVPVTGGSQTMTVGSRNVSVQYVKADAKASGISFKVALANDQMGQVESLGSMAERKNAIAAINGNFFAAYEGDFARNFPYGMVKREGMIEHVGKQKTCIGISSDNQIKMTVLNPAIKGSTNGSFAWPNNWYAYWVNRPVPASGNHVVVLTPSFGAWTGANNGTSVVVEGGVVSEIKTGNTRIPANGYVINLLGEERTRLLNRFSIGTKVSYEIELNPEDQDHAFWNKAESIIGVGPRLLKEGKVAYNPGAEGYVDPKIISNSGARSAIGITWNNEIVMTTATATLLEMAEVMKQLGCKEAMNLDGGWSSTLWHDGKYLTGPGRDLPVGFLVLYEPQSKPISVLVDDKTLEMDVAPLVISGRTLAPVRLILEELGWQMRWDSASQTVFATKGESQLKLTLGEEEALYNGNVMPLDVPLMINQGRTLVPIRFIAEVTGAKVIWDDLSKTIFIQTREE